MRRITGVLVAALVMAAGTAPPVGATFKWTLHKQGCEPPDVFYSAAHDPAVPTPCCPRAPERCPGGVACLGATCAPPYGAVPCDPASPHDRPNIILYVADDQGWCHYGFMGPACRSTVTGTAIPVPATPNLDALALQPANEGKGRVFEVGYAGAPVSGPARLTLHAGALLKEQQDRTLPQYSIGHLLHQAPGPYYCTYGGGGKLVANTATLEFDALDPGRGLGRNPCEAAPCAPACDDPPRCGADASGPLSGPQQDFDDFVDSTLIGPRVGGELDPGTTYEMAQPFYIWYGAWLPHVPHSPPPVIEDVSHPPVPGDYLFGPSVTNPGQPRFPFGDPSYTRVFNPKEKFLRGLYGMIWWGDDGLRQIRQRLESIHVWDATGTQAVTLWDRTVIIFIADHGADLPRAKNSLSQNGYRTPIVVYDGGRAPSAAPTRVDEDLVHAVDVMPTILDYAGRTPPPLGGFSLKPYVDGTQAGPLRNTMCGHHVRGRRARDERFILTRSGTVGRCAPAAGPSCAADGDCAAGVCLLGTCGSGALCLEDDDCPGGETCGLRAQRWCRYGRDPVLEQNLAPPDQQPTTPCTTDADCAALCPSADPINCTCEHRDLKLYVLSKGETFLMDLFVDPDEPGLDRHLRKRGPQPGDVPLGPGAQAEHLATRLKCCMDQWWTPPPNKGHSLGDPSCTACEPTYRCHRCGDGIVASVEQCDGTAFEGATCASLGFTGGTLACTPGCTFDTSGCT